VGDEERILLRGEFDGAAALAGLQQLSANYRELMTAVGDTDKLKALDEFDAKLQAAGASMAQLKEQAAGQGGGGAAALRGAGEAAGQSVPEFDASRRSIALLGSELGRIVGLGPQVGGIFTQMVAGVLNPWTMAIMSAVAAVSILNKAFEEGDQRAQAFRDTLRESGRAAAEATQSISDYYQSLRRAAGAPGQMGGLESAELAAQLQATTGLTAEEGQRVAAEATAAGLEPDELGLFAETVATGDLQPEDARRFARQYRRDPAGTRARYEPRGVEYRGTDVAAERRLQGQAALRAIRQAQTPEARLRHGAQVLGTTAQTEQAMGDISLWRQAVRVSEDYARQFPGYGPLGHRFWSALGYETEVEKMQAARADPAVRATEEMSGVRINGAGLVIIQPRAGSFTQPRMSPD